MVKTKREEGTVDLEDQGENTPVQAPVSAGPVQAAIEESPPQAATAPVPAAV